MTIATSSEITPTTTSISTSVKALPPRRPAPAGSTGLEAPCFPPAADLETACTLMANPPELWVWQPPH
jgi:hypothetical protein